MKDDRLYLIHIVECAERVERYTIDGKAAFFDDTKTQDAVVRNLQIAAEATQDLSEKVRASRPDVEWRSIRSFRNRVVHDYLGVDLDVVWRSRRMTYRCSGAWRKSYCRSASRPAATRPAAATQTRSAGHGWEASPPRLHRGAPVRPQHVTQMVILSEAKDFLRRGRPQRGGFAPGALPSCGRGASLRSE